MLRSVRLIALHTTPYSDRHGILSAYSRELGRTSFLVPAGGGREAARRRALLQPLSAVECVARITPGRDVHTMSEPRPLLTLHTVMADPVRSVMAMFLAEVLGGVLRQSDAEEPLFDFLLDAVRRLNDPATPVANFHLAFLYRLSAFLGVEPDTTDYRPGRVFDMLGATFRTAPPLHGRYVAGEEARALMLLSRMTWENMHTYKYTRAERARALELMLDYLRLHQSGLTQLRSLSVLQQIFDT